MTIEYVAVGRAGAHAPSTDASAARFGATSLRLISAGVALTIGAALASMPLYARSVEQADMVQVALEPDPNYKQMGYTCATVAFEPGQAYRVAARIPADQTRQIGIRFMKGDCDDRPIFNGFWQVDAKEMDFVSPEGGVYSLRLMGFRGEMAYSVTPVANAAEPKRLKPGLPLSMAKVELAQAQTARTPIIRSSGSEDPSPAVGSAATSAAAETQFAMGPRPVPSPRARIWRLEEGKPLLLFGGVRSHFTYEDALSISRNGVDYSGRLSHCFQIDAAPGEVWHVAGRTTAEKLPPVIFISSGQGCINARPDYRTRLDLNENPYFTVKKGGSVLIQVVTDELAPVWVQAKRVASAPGKPHRVGKTRPLPPAPAAPPFYAGTVSATSLPAGIVEPFSTIRDCASCPEMVVLPAGNVVIGSDPGDRFAHASDSPRHEATISRTFAIGRFEVTRDEFGACVSAGACQNLMKTKVVGREPVTHLRPIEVLQYLSYLNHVTGNTYALPSAAEWEYAARGGSTGPWPTGATILESEANINLSRKGPVPVGSYAPNGFGLHDMIGNVGEVVLWTDPDNPQRKSLYKDDTDKFYAEVVVRGGDWKQNALWARSATQQTEHSRFLTNGFRVARVVTPKDAQSARPSSLVKADTPSDAPQRLAQMEKEFKLYKDTRAPAFNAQMAASRAARDAAEARRRAQQEIASARHEAEIAAFEAELAADQSNGPRNILEAFQKGFSEEMGRQQELNRQSQQVVNRIAAMERAQQRRREAEQARERAAAAAAEDAAERQRLDRVAAEAQERQRLAEAETRRQTHVAGASVESVGVSENSSTNPSQGEAGASGGTQWAEQYTWCQAHNGDGASPAARASAPGESKRYLSYVFSSRQSAGALSELFKKVVPAGFYAACHPGYGSRAEAEAGREATAKRFPKNPPVSIQFDAE